MSNKNFPKTFQSKSSFTNQNPSMSNKNFSIKTSFPQSKTFSQWEFFSESESAYVKDFTLWKTWIKACPNKIRIKKVFPNQKGFSIKMALCQLKSLPLRKTFFLMAAYRGWVGGAAGHAAMNIILEKLHFSARRSFSFKEIWKNLVFESTKTLYLRK